MKYHSFSSSSVTSDRYVVDDVSYYWDIISEHSCIGAGDDDDDDSDDARVSLSFANAPLSYTEYGDGDGDGCVESNAWFTGYIVKQWREVHRYIILKFI